MLSGTGKLSDADMPKSTIILSQQGTQQKPCLGLLARLQSVISPTYRAPAHFTGKGNFKK